ncbi:helix-turn-helix domain-containing protein [Candidatus Fukatsuia endosymbiont of Tuberolachnus salignus]|uniref:helix-turn-helix domain-containing protein n=1 Tax=Candidatus Fukatsuia endosymbiont of Tuberolachnus salignus TaxID=3077957 RepID=UPI00313DE81A
MKRKNCPISNPLTARLKYLIEKKSISKAEMARICDVTPQSVNNWFVRGKIGKDSALKLSKHLGVSVAWMLEESDENTTLEGSELPHPPLTPTERSLLILFNELPEKDAKEILEILKEKKQYYDQLIKELAHKRGLKST